MLYSYSWSYSTRARKKVALYSKNPFCLKIGSKFFLANLLMILPIPGSRTWSFGQWSCTLQMKSRWESNINVRFPFMYSQKWNCAGYLFPKHNYNVLFPNSYTHISVRDLYVYFQDRCGLILGICKSLTLQTHECGNWDWGRVIPRKGIP